MHKTVQKFH